MKKHRTLIITIGIGTLLLLGWFVNDIGGVGIRRNAANGRSLTINSPLVPGIPFSVRWDAEMTSADRSVLLIIRDQAGETELAAARFKDGIIVVTLPCRTVAGGVSILLTELLTGRVIAQQAAIVLPAGPDCLQ